MQITVATSNVTAVKKLLTALCIAVLLFVVYLTKEQNNGSVRITDHDI